MKTLNIIEKEGKKSPLEQRNFTRFSEKIESIKKPISTALGGVLEYQKNDINYISIKLFNSNTKEVSKQDIENAHMFIEHYNNKLKRIKDEMMQEPNISDPQKQLLLNIIQGISLRSILLYYATYIEAEKGGYKLDPKEKIEYLKNIEKIETIIYGEKISDTIEEKRIIINHLGKKFNKNKSLLNTEETKTFQNFLSKSGINTETEVDEKIDGEEEKNIILEKISIINVCYLFQKVLNIYKIKNKIVIIKDNITEEKEENNILYIPTTYDQKQRDDVIKKYKLKTTVKILLDKNLPNFGIGEYKVDIPGNYESLTIKRVCELIDHEIGIHLLRMINKKKSIDIKTEGYLETEEGVATMNEKLVAQKKEDIKIDEPTIHNISTFIAENYSFEETKKILYTYYILQEKSSEEAENLSEQRALRTKRYHAFDLPGANRKDVVYRRGLVDAVEYIKSLDQNKEEDLKQLEKDIGNFMISKLGKEEVQNADEIFKGFSIDKNKLIMPIAIGKILYEKLLGNSLKNIDDIRFLATKQKLDHKQLKNILEIISFIKGNTENNEYEGKEIA